MLAALLLLAAFIRLHGLGSVAPLEDEYFQFFSALQPGDLAGFLGLIRENPHHVLLDPLGTFLLGRVSDATFWLRLPSVVYGVAAVAAVWSLCGDSGRPGRRPLAAFLLAVSLPAIEWSRRADFYSLLILVSAGAAAAFLAAIERPRSWPRLAAWAAAFLYAHPYAAVAAAFQGAWLARGLRRGGVASGAAAAALKAWGLAAFIFLPWWVWSFHRLADPDLFSFRGGPGDLPLGPFLAGVPAALSQPDAGTAAALLTGLYAAAWLTSLSGALRGRGDAVLRFSHAALPAGVAAVVAADLATGYFFAGRQLLWLLPFWLVVVADGMLAWCEALPQARHAGFLRGALPVFLSALVLPASFARTRAQQEEAAGAAALVERLDQHAGAGDCFLFTDGDLAQEFLFGYDRRAFRAAPGWDLRRGHLTFRMPGVFEARGGREFRVTELPGAHAPDETRPWRCWLFTGRIDDLYVNPPRRPKR